MDPIRSPIYPGFFAIFLKIVQILGVDSNWIVYNLSYLVQAPLVAGVDWVYWMLAHLLFSHRTAQVAVRIVRMFLVLLVSLQQQHFIDASESIH